MLRPAVLALGSLLLFGCHITFGRSSVEVDGVELPAEHTETLEIAAWSASGLMVDSPLGDLRVEPTDGPSTITVTLYEVEVGDATAFYEEGKLISRTSSGEPSGIGQVIVRSNGPIPSLTLTTGMGDITITDVHVTDTAKLETGMGDIEVDGIGSVDRIEANSGMGDVEVAGASCRTLTVSSGMGDVDVRGVSASEGSLSSGMGDIDIRRSDFEQLSANTGLGDVKCRETTYGRGELDTGLGSVTRR